MPFVVEEEFFGLYANPITKEVERIRKFTITNDNNMKVSILNYGATVHSIVVPDAYNDYADVVLGFDDVAGYLKSKQFKIGNTVGRVAGCITDARIQLDEVSINLSKNCNEMDHCDGGVLSFDVAVWSLANVLNDGIVLEHYSPDGHEGYPGNMRVRVTFQLTNVNALRILIEAEADQPTIVNITSNLYFNLVGHSAGRVALCEHTMLTKSSFVVDINDQRKPTGEFKCVADTVWDMHVPTNIGDRLKQFDGLPLEGYDNCLCINNANGTDLIEAARIKHINCGRVLEVFTNQPGVRFYTGNDLPELRLGEFPLVGKKCSRYTKFGAFCLTPTKYPDAMQFPNFPSIRLKPHEKYINDTLYKFSVEESWKCCR